MENDDIKGSKNRIRSIISNILTIRESKDNYYAELSEKYKVKSLIYSINSEVEYHPDMLVNLLLVPGIDNSIKDSVNDIVSSFILHYMNNVELMWEDDEYLDSVLVRAILENIRDDGLHMSYSRLRDYYKHISSYTNSITRFIEYFSNLYIENYIESVRIDYSVNNSIKIFYTIES